MPLFDIAMIVIQLLKVIIHRYSSDTCDRSVIIFDKLAQRLLPLTKKSHLRMLIDFRLLGVIELPRLSTIDRTIHPISNLHQSGLRLQTLAGGLSIADDVPQKITFQEHDRVVML